MEEGVLEINSIIFFFVLIARMPNSSIVVINFHRPLCQSCFIQLWRNRMNIWRRWVTWGTFPTFEFSLNFLFILTFSIVIYHNNLTSLDNIFSLVYPKWIFFVSWDSSLMPTSSNYNKNKSGNDRYDIDKQHHSSNTRQKVTSMPTIWTLIDFSTVGRIE